MARIIDEGVKSSEVGVVINLGLMMLIITALGACFAATRNILASKVSQSFGADLRYDEKEIQHALLTLMENRTSFLIAHRLSTIRDADKIMVIGNGEILESGNHNELMKSKGAYYEMVLSQMGNYKD